MEVSLKYSLEDIDRLAEKSGFRVEKNFFDRNRYFTDSLWILKIRQGTVPVPAHPL
jgi:L-histidine Nalpha-methyltransferase